MTTVPVKVNAPALTLSVTENPGYLTIESGQNTHWFEEAKTSVIHLAVVYPASHPITVTLGNGFSQIVDTGLTPSGYGTFKTMVLQANAEDVTFPIELPITVPSGGWVEGMAILIQNAEPATSPLFSNVTAHELNIDRKRDKFTNTGLIQEPFRMLGYMFLAKEHTSEPTNWFTSTTLNLPGVNSTGAIKVPGQDLYLNLFVIPTPEMYLPQEDYKMTYNFSGGLYLRGTFFVLNMDEEFPPLCNDPSHAPVTITITAHGPVDFQVE